MTAKTIDDAAGAPAELAKLTPARVTQIMNLLYLAPRHPRGDLLLAARDRGTASDLGTRPAGRAEDGRVERAAGAVGRHSDGAVASSCSAAPCRGRAGPSSGTALLLLAHRHISSELRCRGQPGQ
jgi:hypothetical protein